MRVTRLQDEADYEGAKEKIGRLEAELAAAREALEESVKLQSHYAVLLNQYDGGKRIGFKNAKAWLNRLLKMAKALGDEPEEGAPSIQDMERESG